MGTPDPPHRRVQDTVFEGEPLAGGSPPRAEDRDVDPFGSLGPGSHVGRRYLIEGVIGRGATGVVFDASHLVVGKRVALKCLYPQHREQPNAVERFFREARIAARVEHPHVIEVYDAGDEDGVLFLAMERLDGESLAERLAHGPLPIQEAIDLFLGIMDGVAAVHAHGVVHRDLKPDNILIVKPRSGRLGGPKVLDFGISKLKEPGHRELTSFGTLLGTPYYMSPEQMANTRDADARADVYSLGVMLYEALTGDVPYVGDSVLDIFERAQAAQAPPIDRVIGAPPELARLVDRAMRPRREERFQAVAQLRDALAGFRSQDTDLAQASAREGEDRPTLSVPPPSWAIAGRGPGRADVPRWIFAALAVAGLVSFLSLSLALIALAT